MSGEALPSGVRLPAACLLAALLAACGGGSDQRDGAGSPALPPGMAGAPRTNADAAPPPVPYDPATPRVVARAAASWPHDTAAYTQGLAVTGARLLESTGLEGRSEVREVERSTGRVRRRAAVPPPLFGEGIAVVRGRLYQLTWLHGRGYVYDPARLAPLDANGIAFDPARGRVLVTGKLWPRLFELAPDGLTPSGPRRATARAAPPSAAPAAPAAPARPRPAARRAT